MKRTLILLSIFLVFTSCSDLSTFPENDNTYREVAYNSLSNQEKETLTVDWKVGRVDEGIYKKKDDNDILELSSGAKLYFLSRVETEYLRDGYKLFAVSFNTKYDALIGPIIVIVDPYLKQAIGGGGRL